MSRNSAWLVIGCLGWCLTAAIVSPCPAFQDVSAEPPAPVPTALSDAPVSVLVLQLEPIGIKPLEPGTVCGTSHSTLRQAQDALTCRIGGTSKDPLAVRRVEIDRRASRAFELRRRALTFRGTRYVRGGAGRTGFDCSGFTQSLYAKMGMALPHRAREQYKMGRPVGITELQVADLVFFNTTGTVSHVGMYIGDGKFVHASSRGGFVRTDTLTAGYYRDRFVGGRRFDLPTPK